MLKYIQLVHCKTLKILSMPVVSLLRFSSLNVYYYLQYIVNCGNQIAIIRSHGVRSSCSVTVWKKTSYM